MVLYTNSLCIENISRNVARNNMSGNRLYVTGEIINPKRNANLTRKQSNTKDFAFMS